MLQSKSKNTFSLKRLKQGFTYLYQAKYLSELYEANFKHVSKYVHATARGHEAIQVAVGMQLLPQDFAFPYYRDDAMILALGMTPKDLILQLLAKKDDPFSGGRTYYAHPSINDEDKPKVPHQSSATGMQAIPATGAAMGMKYKEIMNIDQEDNIQPPLVLCSLGDACITEGEVSEAFQMAALKQLPILFLVQDNEWDISASAEEIRAQDAYQFIQGFHGIEAHTINGSDFIESYKAIEYAIKKIRKERRPFLIHAKVPLLNHHTSGVRMEWYRDDLEEDRKMDPYPFIKTELVKLGMEEKAINKLEEKIRKSIDLQYEEAQSMPEPEAKSISKFIFKETEVKNESGSRSPIGGEKTVMVDCALHAIEEIMRNDNASLLYGQDVGHRLGGVFREAATLAQKFGSERVFNTPIQEAFIVGSTVGMSAVGLKPIVEVQFADYIWPGLNQLFTEVSRSYYLSNGKWPVNMILRVPIGAYGSGGPYHSGSVESIVTNIKGLKVIYPSNGADLKGLFKAAYLDPNPVVCFEHKGLYWSKVPGTQRAKVTEPSEDYILPIGKANMVLEANKEMVNKGQSMCIVTYGMGVHWSLNAAESFEGQVSVLDLRTLVPLDEEAIFKMVNAHGKCLVVTEEPESNSFARSIASLIQERCFESLDAPVRVIGAMNMPAIPLNSILEETMLPNADKVKAAIQELLDY